MRARSLAVVAALVLAGCLGTSTVERTDTTGSSTDDLLDVRLSPDDGDAMEVDIAAGPNGTHLVAASNLRGGDYSGFGVYVSSDGGRNWSFDPFQPGDVATVAGEPKYAGLSDPVVEITPDGTVYLSGLAYLPTSAVFVAESHDGGRSFDEVHIVDESDPATEFNDKEWFDVDPETGTIVVAWQKEPVIDSLRSLEYETGLDVDVGNVVVSRSTDGGDSWSDPVEVDRGMHNNGTQVDFADGVAHMIWVNYEANTIDHVRSGDAGATWSSPEPIAEVRPVPPFDDYQRMHTLPALAAGPDGTLVAAWHGTGTGDPDVRLVASPDGGRTWGEAVPVVGDDAGVQIYPWIDVGPDGTVHVTYYDGTTEGDFPLRYVHRTAEVGPAGEVTLGDATPVSPSFDVADRNGLLGDYTSVVATDDAVHPAWADGRGDRPQIRSARLPWHPS